jgi:16S rRNA C967 or C1407 C5-methylase (RsmB/RsmF family)
MSRNSQTRRRGKVKKPPVDRDKALLITSSVPGEKGFHFFTEVQKPTGIFATSIFDFLEQLKKVDLKSLEFHLKRNDFQKWLREVIRDDWLAEEFEKLRALDLSADRLRVKLVEVTEERCKQLSDALKHLTL